MIPPTHKEQNFRLSKSLEVFLVGTGPRWTSSDNPQAPAAVILSKCTSPMLLQSAAPARKLTRTHKIKRAQMDCLS